MIRETDPKLITHRQAADVIKAVEDYRARTSASLKYIANALGMSPSVISEVLSQQYDGDWQSVIMDLDRWLDDELRAEQAPKPTEFVRTKVAEEIFTVAEAAVTLKGIGLVYGPAGVGKTLALRAIAAEKAGSMFVSIETAASSAAGVIEAIAKSARVTPNSRQEYSSRRLLKAIKDKLVGTPRLLIIDEIHKLCGQADDKALHTLRDLHDATGIPMLWCGTTDLVEYLETRRNDRREPLSQIRRRIVICRDLAERTVSGDGGAGEPLYTITEIRAVFAKAQMRLAPDAARYLARLANTRDSGALGACKNLVVMAIKVHEKSGQVLTADMLHSVHRLLVNRRAFKRLEDEADVAMPMAQVG